MDWRHPIVWNFPTNAAGWSVWRHPADLCEGGGECKHQQVAENTILFLNGLVQNRKIYQSAVSEQFVNVFNASLCCRMKFYVLGLKEWNRLFTDFFVSLEITAVWFPFCAIAAMRASDF